MGCHHGDSFERICLTQCGHGMFHLHVGAATVHLRPSELAMVGQVINRVVHKHPGMLKSLSKSDWDSVSGRISFE